MLDSPVFARSGGIGTVFAGRHNNARYRILDRNNGIGVLSASLDTVTVLFR